MQSNLKRCSEHVIFPRSEETFLSRSLSLFLFLTKRQGHQLSIRTAFRILLTKANFRWHTILALLVTHVSFWMTLIFLVPVSLSLSRLSIIDGAGESAPSSRE